MLTTSFCVLLDRSNPLKSFCIIWRRHFVIKGLVREMSETLARAVGSYCNIVLIWPCSEYMNNSLDLYISWNISCDHRSTLLCSDSPDTSTRYLQLNIYLTRSPQKKKKKERRNSLTICTLPISLVFALARSHRFLPVFFLLYLIISDHETMTK